MDCGHQLNRSSVGVDGVALSAKVFLARRESQATVDHVRLPPRRAFRSVECYANLTINGVLIVVSQTPKRMPHVQACSLSSRLDQLRWWSGSQM